MVTNKFVVKSDTNSLDAIDSIVSQRLHLGNFSLAQA